MPWPPSSTPLFARVTRLRRKSRDADMLDVCDGTERLLREKAEQAREIAAPTEEVAALRANAAANTHGVANAANGSTAANGANKKTDAGRL
jgi:hypothetical protein